MRYMNFIPLSFALLFVASVCGLSCGSDVASECEYTGTCPVAGSAGFGGATAGDAAGNPSGGDPTQGGASAGLAGEGAAGGSGSGESGAAGAGGAFVTTPCGGQCLDDKPVCDEAADECVQCLQNPDCAPGTKEKCDTDTNTCVECLESLDCTTATAARCDDGACIKCQSNADCAHLSGKTVCDVAAGECVQCTGTDYAACGADMGTPLVCDSLKRACSTNKKASAGLCQSCVADDQCTAGKLCVKEQFGTPANDVGYFCFWKQGGADGAPSDCFTEGAPYAGVQSQAISVDGAKSDICKLRTSTCVARNQFSSKDCKSGNSGNDSLCGFAPPKDSKCDQIGVSVNYRCTMTCGNDSDCPTGFACNTGVNPAVCEL